MFNQEHWLTHNQALSAQWKQYLARQMSLVSPPTITMRDQLCQAAKASPVQQEGYQFECEQRGSLFVQLPRLREKYIRFTDISAVLNVDEFAEHIHFIRRLDELPSSTREAPKVVRALNAIKGRLRRPFYGIVITDYPFDVTDRQIVGFLYSSYENLNYDEDVRWNRMVFNNLQRQFSLWQTVPYSLQYAYDVP